MSGVYISVTGGIASSFMGIVLFTALLTSFFAVTSLNQTVP